MIINTASLKIKNLSITFESKDQAVEALKNISLDVKKNEFLSIVGPSGCGKTTLLNAIGGLLSLTSGEILYQNSDAKNIGFVFQDSTLLPWKNVIDNVVLPLEIKRGENKNKFYCKARKLLEFVGLEKLTLFKRSN